MKCSTGLIALTLYALGCLSFPMVYPHVTGRDQSRDTAYHAMVVTGKDQSLFLKILKVDKSVAATGKNPDVVSSDIASYNSIASQLSASELSENGLPKSI